MCTCNRTLWGFRNEHRRNLLVRVKSLQRRAEDRAIGLVVAVGPAETFVLSSHTAYFLHPAPVLY